MIADADRKCHRLTRAYRRWMHSPDYEREVLEMSTTDADRIAQLTAELAEAIEQRDIARAEWQGADCKADAMRAERDAAQVVATATLRALAVTRAALAQCVEALESACAWVRGNDEPSRVMAREEQRRISAVLANPDVEHAVCVEAARDAVIQAARPFSNVGATTTGPGVVLRDAFAVLDALTSGRKR